MSDNKLYDKRDAAEVIKTARKLGVILKRGGGVTQLHGVLAKPSRRGNEHLSTNQLPLEKTIRFRTF